MTELNKAPTKQGPAHLALVEDCGIEAYANNPLIDACGPILSPEEIVRSVISLPPKPAAAASKAPHLLQHELGSLWRLHIPSDEGIQTVQMFDWLVRQGYVHRRPGDPMTRRLLSGLPSLHTDASPIQLLAAIAGLSGVGKTQAIVRALALMPQVVVHEHLAGLMGPVRQLLWLMIDVPPSGRLVDLAEALLRATDTALGTDYLERASRGRNGISKQSAAAWVANVQSHFPGILVLDEVQSFFRLQSRERRLAVRQRGEMRPELRIVEDEALKFVLNLTNTSKIPVVLAGTPDGIHALETRMSTASRVSTGGLINFPHAQTPEDLFMSKLFPYLQRYQWLPKKVEISAEWRALIHRLSAGICRNIIGLWFHGQRHALARGATCLEPKDLEWAAQVPQKLNQSAVLAVLSQDPQLMGNFEDLIASGLR